MDSGIYELRNSGIQGLNQILREFRDWGIRQSVTLTQQISSLLDYQKKAKEMGANGRIYFKEHFERKEITKHWKDVLEEVSSKQEAVRSMEHGAKHRFGN